MLVNLIVLFLVMLMLVNLLVLFLAMLMLVNLARPVPCHVNVNKPTRPVPCHVNVSKPVYSTSNCTLPLRKLNKVKPPKWEKCDYVHVPSRPVSVSCSVTRPVKRPVKRRVKRHVTRPLSRPVSQSIPCPTDKSDSQHTQLFMFNVFIIHILNLFRI